MHPRSRNLSPAPGSARLAASFVQRQLQAVGFHSGGSEIYGQGEPAKYLYQVEFGAVRSYRLLADGRRQISAFHLAGEVFGFEADSIHHFFADALVATGIRVIRPSANSRPAAIGGAASSRRVVVSKP